MNARRSATAATIYARQIKRYADLTSMGANHAKAENLTNRNGSNAQTTRKPSGPCRILFEAKAKYNKANCIAC